MKQQKVKILKNEKVAEGFYRMRVASDYFGSQTSPGQFFEVRCSLSTEPLLRRPLGAHRIWQGGIEMLYEVVGKGTSLLSAKRAGEDVDIIGPLGKGFTVSEEGDALLVAGGIGVAPLLALAERINKGADRMSHRKKNIVVIIGAKTRAHVLCEKEFRLLGCEVLVATEDGSKGKKGLATDILKNLLFARRLAERAAIYACGPTAMLKAVADIAKAGRMPCQVSLEERMACGIGVCLGCPVRIKSDVTTAPSAVLYKMVCKDGPVFNAEDIVW
ncbi:MAG: dihydroorotate dehydrogenase electron transfer subunit [Candidatus Omnitrophica bacterium]|nr:dihydroorotate dehydrogenase electron transfer subunit [Candidatus Omnitrophota bacterium]MCM8791382.1 dihydroorotate dehydrogenase electron transfer subunit [Candidatus Omnitrophota bacterium]